MRGPFNSFLRYVRDNIVAGDGHVYMQINVNCNFFLSSEIMHVNPLLEASSILYIVIPLLPLKQPKQILLRAVA